MHPLIPYFERIKFDIPIPGFGTLPIHGFGILVALGFILGSQMSMRKCRRDGLDPEMVNKLLGWLVLGVFVGGHLGYALFYDPKEMLKNPVELLKVWEGLSSFGGFIACAGLTWWFFRKEKVPFWPYADTIAYGLTLGWFFGRMGCFVAHDHPGTVTNFWLGVPGMCPSSTGRPDPLVACHDMGLYEALFSFALMIAFILLDRKPRFSGFYVAMLATAYAPVRFLMDFLRHPDVDVRYAGLTPAQYGSVVLLALGVAMLVWRAGSPAVRTANAAPPPEPEPPAPSEPPTEGTPSA